MRKLLSSEVFKYLFFDVLATLAYMETHLVIFALTQLATTSTVIADVITIVFAFFTNDHSVSNQVRTGWFNRFIKFFVARLSTPTLGLILVYLLVIKFPHIIGQFVDDNISLVDMVETVFSQVLIIVLDYVFSKLLISKDEK